MHFLQMRQWKWLTIFLPCVCVWHVINSEIRTFQFNMRSMCTRFYYSQLKVHRYTNTRINKNTVIKINFICGHCELMRQARSHTCNVFINIFFSVYSNWSFNWLNGKWLGFHCVQRKPKQEKKTLLLFCSLVYGFAIVNSPRWRVENQNEFHSIKIPFWHRFRIFLLLLFR